MKPVRVETELLPDRVPARRRAHRRRGHSLALVEGACRSEQESCADEEVSAVEPDRPHLGCFERAQQVVRRDRGEQERVDAIEYAAVRREQTARVLYLHIALERRLEQI